MSVLIATYNRSAMLEESLASVLEQSLAPHQVIVIDDGSTDGTAERLAQRATQVEYMRLSNGGKSRALNAAMPHVTGDYVWVFDDDDVALPTSIADRVRILEDQPDCEVVFSKHYWGATSADGSIERGELITWPDVNTANLRLTLMRGCFTTLQGALVRAEAYRRVGPFREELLRSQDYDMLVRLARTCRVALLPEPTFVFRRHAGQRGPASQRHGAHEREKLWAKYDGMFGRELRREVALGEYLSPPVTQPLTVEQERAATLNRLTVMASKGLVSEMIEDAATLATLMERNGSGLSDAERLLVRGATQQRYLLVNALDDASGFLAAVHILADSSSGQALLRGFARGLAGVAWWGLDAPRERSRAVWLAARLAAKGGLRKTGTRTL